MNGPPPADGQDLELRWQGLTRPVGERLAAERVRDWAGGPVLVALDASGVRHLLIRTDEERVGQLPRPVVGLKLAVRRLRPADQPEAVWFDLSTGGSSWDRTFCGLCADVIAELPAGGAPEAVTLFAVLERWRRFWASASGGLSRDEQVGLVGELWLLLEWLPRVTVRSITAWQGPLRGRHDFVTAEVSIEVKATSAATGPVVHRVARLDQLDEPGTGQLYLLSLRAVTDPLGRHSLDALLGRVRYAASVAGPLCTSLLENRLKALGITAADEGRYTEPLRIAQQELFHIGPGFPRLVASSFPQGLPSGVVDVAYSLDTSACRPWLVSDAPPAVPLATLL